MNEKYLYLWLNILSISIPLLFSFYKPAPFYKKWKYLWIAILVPAAIFIVWDEWFTQMGIWGFNPRYLTGFYIGSLPLEEVLFFICIPYACVFTYEALNFLIRKDMLRKFQSLITWVLASTLLLVGLLHYSKWYTVVTFLSLSVYLLGLNHFTKPSYLGRFYLAYLFILIPFFIVNGILTGSFIEQEVVWYNPTEQLDILIGTIPIEDTFYGMLLILMNVSILEFLQKRKIPSG